ncbi:MAG: prevent-host-death protein, partial [Methylotenera sp.]
QSVLSEGETLSSFLEESLRANIERRLHQQAFITRGIASRDEAKVAQEYYSADSVIAELANIYQQAFKQAQ